MFNKVSKSAIFINEQLYDTVYIFEKYKENHSGPAAVLRSTTPFLISLGYREPGEISSYHPESAKDSFNMYKQLGYFFSTDLVLNMKS